MLPKVIRKYVVQQQFKRVLIEAESFEDAWLKVFVKNEGTQIEDSLEESNFIEELRTE